MEAGTHFFKAIRESEKKGEEDEVTEKIVIHGGSVSHRWCHCDV